MERAYIRFGIVGLASLALLQACDRKPAPDVTPPETGATAPIVELALSSSVQGWRTDPEGYALYNKVLTAFAAQTMSGETVSSESLEGRWTILALWALWSDESLAETPYLNAVASAANQDADLDFEVLHIPPPEGDKTNPFGAYQSHEQGLKDQGGAWPMLVDTSGSAAKALGSPKPPVYLLIGPDLTIEAWRPALNSDAPEGVKPMFRGVAEIKKMVAAPR